MNRQIAKWIGIVVGIMLGDFCVVHVWAHYREIPVYVLEQRSPTGKILARMGGPTSKFATMPITIQVPYERAADKRISPADIAAIRWQLEWHRGVPYFPQSIEILHGGDVEAIRFRRLSIEIVILSKVEGQWTVVTASEGKLHPCGFTPTLWTNICELAGL